MPDHIQDRFRRVNAAPSQASQGFARRLSAWLCVGASAVLLAACGGGGPGTNGSASTSATAGSSGRETSRASAQAVNPGNWVAIPVPSDPLLQNLTIPTDAPSKGMWSATQTWPLNGLHVVVLPNGKLLSFGTTLDGGAQNGRYFDVWDPAQGFTTASHNTTYRAEQQDSFCSTATFLTDGQLMISGGNGGVSTNLYSPSANTVATSPNNLADERWYATMLTLPDGRPLMLGGMVPYSEGMQDNPDQAVSQGLASMTPEIYESTGWRSLFNAYSREAFGPDYLRASYPRAWVMPSGMVFGVSAEKMWTLDPSGNGGNGSLTIHGAFKTAPNTTTKPNVGATNSAVMFDIGKVLIVGGNGSFNGDGMPASKMATLIDVNSGTPVLTEQPAMTNARRYANTVVLPDGQVLVTGGTLQGNSNGTNAVYAAEIWRPGTGAWTVGASAKVYRGYHSFTVLLPNGTVLSTGGGTPGPVTNLNAEVYYPPQLFRTASGKAELAPRPVMSAISGLNYTNGADMQIDMADASPISQLVLIGVSSGTHSFNSGQRRIPLSFRQDTIRLTTQLPDAFKAPPGYYQVIAIDAAGVPSRGTIVAIGLGVAPPPVVTTPYNPPNIDAVIDAQVIPAGGTARYSVINEQGTTYSWDFGDGSAATAPSGDSTVSHVYAQPGLYTVMLTAQSGDAASGGATSRRSFVQAVSVAATARKPSASSAMALEARASASHRLWVANPDTDTVAVIDTVSRTRVAEIAVGKSPRSVAVAPDGRIWVVNKGAATLSIVDAGTLAVAQTIALPRASRPHGLAFSPDGGSAFVALEGKGQLLKLNPSTGAQVSSLALGLNVRHVAVTADSATVLVSRFITPSLPGEATAVVDTSSAGAEVLAVQAGTMTLNRSIVLRHSDRTDTEIQGAGIPNYLGAAAISPDGASAWVPSKLDNIKRGTLRNGEPLNFQNTVRAVSSRITLSSLAEDLSRRIDHDNASVASAAAFHASGAYLFVALETSRQVAVINAFNGGELLRIDTGRAPQGLALSADGQTLYVQNFMDRSLSIVDLTPLVRRGELRAGQTTVVSSVGTEKLTAQVLLGKQLFYDAKDPRLARDSYMSCASCHNDGEHDGRTWDLTGFGEGLRNTISLKGRAATGHGFLHWSANFDEVQDFEKQIRDFAGGTGLMTDAQYNTGTRNQALGDRKTGVSTDLDALAAYLTSLSTFEPSPLRNTDGTLTTAAQAGKTVFQNANCASCHAGTAFTASGNASGLKNIGTIKASSGSRLGGVLSGLDVPTLRDVWATGPYLHDGSASTLNAAVQAHQGNTVTGTNLDNLVAYLQQIGSEETTAPVPPTNIASSATLSTSYLASGQSLPAIVNGITPASSADTSGGAYGNYRGALYYNRTETVTFTWSAARKISGFEVYWWVDGSRYAAPSSVTLQYLNGSSWVTLPAVGMTANKFNTVNFTAITTTQIRVSMKSSKATGILEARVLGN